LDRGLLVVILVLLGGGVTDYELNTEGRLCVDFDFLGSCDVLCYLVENALRGKVLWRILWNL
jgi:hypothetical protein